MTQIDVTRWTAFGHETRLRTIWHSERPYAASHSLTIKVGANSKRFKIHIGFLAQYQYRHSRSEVETWYREENFREGFQVLADGGYVATKNIAPEGRSK